MRILAGFMAAALSLPAWAAKWEVVAVGNDNYVHFVDMASLAPHPQGLKVWTKVIKQPSATPSSDLQHDLSRFFSPGSWRRLEAINCRTKQSGTLREIGYADEHTDGSVVSSKSSPTAPMEDVVPDTVGEALLQHVCAGTQPRSKPKPRTTPTSKAAQKET